MMAMDQRPNVTYEPWEVLLLQYLEWRGLGAKLPLQSHFSPTTRDTPDYREADLCISSIVFSFLEEKLL